MLSFTTLYLLLVLSLSFWGRRILSLVKVERHSYGQTLPITAGLAWLVFLCSAIYPYIRNYQGFLTLFYFAGLIGFSIEFIIFYFKNIKNKEHKISTLKQALLQHKTLMATLILAMIFAFIYSVVWPSGSMDNWMDTSADYYAWIFISEYLVGGIRTETLELNHYFSSGLFDAFGTYNIIDLISVANLKTPLLASSAVSVTFLVWWATAIYFIIKRVFGFRFRYSLVLTLGVSVSWLFTYIIVFGMFGHLVAMTSFLVALEQIIPSEEDGWPAKQPIRKLFFPLFVLFMSYQAGYVPSALLVIMTASLLAFFSLKNRPLSSRLLRAFGRGLFPVLFLTAIFGLLMPGVFYHMGFRIQEVVEQISGWNLPLFSPLFFSGLPYYPHRLVYSSYVSEGYHTSVLQYIPFVLIVIILLVTNLTINSKKTLTENDGNSDNNGLFPTFQPKAVLTLTIVFLTCLMVYLTGYFLYNHIYRVWKFAAYTVLPLSFLPTALAFSLLIRLIKKNQKHVLNLICVFSVILFFIQFINLRIEAIPNKYFNMRSARRIIRTIGQISVDIPYNSTIIVDLSSLSHNLIAAIILGNNNFIRTKFVTSLFFISQNINYYKLFSKNTYILSDVNYKELISSSLLSASAQNFFVYNFPRIRKQGHVEIHGNNLFENRLTKYSKFNWYIKKSPIYAIFTIPIDKINKNLLLSFNLNPKTSLPLPCQKGRIGIFLENNEIRWTEHEIGSLFTPVPAEMTSSGVLKTVLEAGPFPEAAAHSDTADNQDIVLCNFEIESLNLLYFNYRNEH